MNLKLERIFRIVAGVIDAINDWLGGWIFALLALPLLYAVCHEVISRYVFDAPTDWSYEVTYMVYGAFFMLGSAYTLLKGGHVRTDIFYLNWSFRRRGIIDATLYFFCFFPGFILFFWIGLVEANHAYIISEHSDATPWMPPLTPFKSTIPLAAALLIMQGVSEFLKSLYAAITGRQLLTGREQ